MWLELEMGWLFKVVKTKDGERVVQLCNKKLEREREIGRVLCTKFDIFIFIISMIIINL